METQQPNFSENETQVWRERLFQRRQALINQEKSNDQQAYEVSPEGQGDLSKIRLHPADFGTDTFESEMRSSVNEMETKQIQDIEDAEQRLFDGTFGACENCGEQIDRARLEAIPETRYCLKCETEMETQKH